MQPEIAERDPFLKRVRARLADRNRWPRHWWYPLPYREYEEVSHETLDTDHKSCSDTIRRSMLTLLGLSLFCLATAFGATDVDQLKGDPTIEIPFADVKMSFVGFLVVAPLLLIVVSVYLHLFVGHKLLLEDIQEDHSPINQTPTLFNLGHPIARWLTAFIFYWLVPLVLAVITQVARTRLEWGLALGGVTVVTTAVFLVLQIRRCTLWRRCVVESSALGIVGGRRRPGGLARCEPRAFSQTLEPRSRGSTRRLAG